MSAPLASIALLRATGSEEFVEAFAAKIAAETPRKVHREGRSRATSLPTRRPGS